MMVYYIYIKYIEDEESPISILTPLNCQVLYKEVFNVLQYNVVDIDSIKVKVYNGIYNDCNDLIAEDPLIVSENCDLDKADLSDFVDNASEG